MNFTETEVISVSTSQREQSELGTVSVRILVVDDFEPYRKVTTAVLSKEPGFQIVGEALDGQEAVRKAQELKPDLVVLDIGLPSLNGIEAARQILAVSPDSKLLFLTGNDFPQIVREAFELGASAYVVKADAKCELLTAVQAALLGKQYVSKRLAARGFLDKP